MATIKMKFEQDTYFNGKLVFEAGKVYDVSTEHGWAARWFKRGGIEVKTTGKSPASTKPAVTPDGDVDKGEKKEETEQGKKSDKGDKSQDPAKEL